jgi:hypothetical protein
MATLRWRLCSGLVLYYTVGCQRFQIRGWMRRKKISRGLIIVVHVQHNNLLKVHILSSIVSFYFITIIKEVSYQLIGARGKLIALLVDI